MTRDKFHPGVSIIHHSSSLIHPQDSRAVLKARAEALALEPERAEGEGHIKVLEFFLAYEKYGIELHHVREVCFLKDLTPIPCTPSFVLGVFNVRGRILSVIDLKKFLDLPEKGLGDLNKVLILKSDTMEFGILADEVLGVRSVPLNGLQSRVPTLTGPGQEFFRGISKDGLIVLDGESLLSDQRLVIDEEVRPG